MYQSLYRKYRPQTFSEIYGQDAISMTLTNAIIHDRVAHAYLFSGPRGTGKTSSAKLLAKALNCTNIVDGRICDECENCQLIKNNAHPDVIEIDAASNNGVDEVRDLIEKVKYAPIKGRKKVYIIDEIHMMSQGAFNALLKTLEEPPEHVVFILATTEHHKVLATIKSRCQRFNFKKLSEEDIIACLENILKSEQANYDREGLKIIAAQSDGGMRDAISMLEQVLIYSNDNVDVATINEVLDLVSQTKIKELYDLIIAQKLNEVLEYLDTLSKSSVDYKQIINEIIDLAIDNLVKLKVEHQDLNKQRFLLNLVEKFDEASDKLKYDNSKRLYLELAILKSINFQKELVTNEEVYSQPSVFQENSIEKNIELVPSREEVVPVVVDTPVVEKVEPSIKPIEEPTIIPPSFTTPSNEEEVQDSVLVDDNQVSLNIFDEQPQVSEPVSQEPQVFVENKEVVNEAEVLNVLVQASKDALNIIKDKWSIIEDYLWNKNTKNAAALLMDSIPVAASDDAIIVVVRDGVEKTLINDLENVQANAIFLSNILDKQHYCFALTKDDWAKAKQNYIELRQTNNLPQPQMVLKDCQFKEHSEEVVEEVVIKEDKNLVFAKEIFKDKLEIKREEEENGY